jgi:hypothetical protein
MYTKYITHIQLSSLSPSILPSHWHPPPTGLGHHFLSVYWLFKGVSPRYFISYICINNIYITLIRLTPLLLPLLHHPAPYYSTAFNAFLYSTFMCRSPHRSAFLSALPVVPSDRLRPTVTIIFSLPLSVYIYIYVYIR